MKQLREFAQHKREFDDLNTRVVGISVDDVRHAHQVWDKTTDRQLTILSDPDRRVIKTYGLLHAKGHEGGDIAIRTTLFIDGQGIMRWWLVSSTAMDIPKAQETLKRIRETSSTARNEKAWGDNTLNYQRAAGRAQDQKAEAQLESAFDL